jgi:hypothetical protein
LNIQKGNFGVKKILNKIIKKIFSRGNLGSRPEKIEWLPLQGFSCTFGVGKNAEGGGHVRPSLPQAV